MSINFLLTGVVPDPDLSEKNDHLLDFPQIDHTIVSLEPTLESEDLFTSGESYLF